VEKTFKTGDVVVWTDEWYGHKCIGVTDTPFNPGEPFFCRACIGFKDDDIWWYQDFTKTDDARYPMAIEARALCKELSDHIEWRNENDTKEEERWSDQLTEIANFNLFQFIKWSRDRRRKIKEDKLFYD